jgi:hypothetical protein
MCPGRDERLGAQTHAPSPTRRRPQWRKGYTERFGFVGVDFRDPRLPRAVKDSGRWLSAHFFKVGA